MGEVLAAIDRNPMRSVPMLALRTAEGTSNSLNWSTLAKMGGIVGT